MYKYQDPTEQAQASIIWMHGLGADSSDMMGLARELKMGSLPVRHVFLDAPLRRVTLNAGMVMPAWYDIIGLTLESREDKEGISQSMDTVRAAFDAELNAGFKPSQIYLAGFSQGGAVALYTALHLDKTLGGVISLSAYLPLSAAIKPCLDPKTPFFIAHGRLDPVVMPKWSLASKEWLLANGYSNINAYEYAMEHSVCHEELRDLSLWLTQKIQGEG